MCSPWSKGSPTPNGGGRLGYGDTFPHPNCTPDNSWLHSGRLLTEGARAGVTPPEQCFCRKHCPSPTNGISHTHRPAYGFRHVYVHTHVPNARPQRFQFIRPLFCCHVCTEAVPTYTDPLTHPQHTQIHAQEDGKMKFASAKYEKQLKCLSTGVQLTILKYNEI